jgi:hypothetical protein
MFAAMRAAGRPVEMHVFERGGHSWGMGAAGSAVAAWPGFQFASICPPLFACRKAACAERTASL